MAHDRGHRLRRGGALLPGIWRRIEATVGSFSACYMSPGALQSWRQGLHVFALVKIDHRQLARQRGNTPIHQCARLSPSCAATSEMFPLKLFTDDPRAGRADEPRALKHKSPSLGAQPRGGMKPILPLRRYGCIGTQWYSTVEDRGTTSCTENLSSRWS